MENKSFINIWPDRKYDIIYADPPWSYKDKALAGKRGACFKYDVMDSLDISKLDVKSLANDDCILFMWATMPKLNEAFDVLSSWGFEYKTCAFVWVKKNKKSDSYFWGMGNWTRANAEICLLAIKGHPKRISAAIHSIIDDPIMGHSKKPNEARERIVSLCGDLPRIELFARERADGWDSFGNDPSLNSGEEID